MQIEKQIRDFLRVYDIKLIMLYYSFTIGKLFLCKDRQSLLHSSGVLHQLKSCVVKIILGKPKVTLFLASLKIERVKFLKFANIG